MMVKCTNILIRQDNVSKIYIKLKKKSLSNMFHIHFFFACIFFQLRQSQAYCTDTGCPQECTYNQNRLVPCWLNFVEIAHFKLQAINYKCSDRLCVIVVPGPGGPAGDSGDLTLPMMVMGWMVLALLLFLFRPSSLRGPHSADKSPGPNNVCISYTSSAHIGITFSNISTDVVYDGYLQ